MIGSRETDGDGRPAPKRDEHGRLQILSSSLVFEGPAPGNEPEEQQTGLLVTVELVPLDTPGVDTD